MQQFTINATTIRPQYSDIVNKQRFDKMPEIVANTLTNYGIDGFTMYPVMGYWQGEREDSYKIEVLTDKGFDVMAEVAEILRDMYNQDAVMVTYPDNSVKFIERL